MYINFLSGESINNIPIYGTWSSFNGSYFLYRIDLLPKAGHGHKDLIEQMTFLNERQFIDWTRYNKCRE